MNATALAAIIAVALSYVASIAAVANIQGGRINDLAAQVRELTTAVRDLTSRVAHLERQP